VDSVEVSVFGKTVKAVCHEGIVMFDRESFGKAIGSARAKRLYAAMNEAFEFLGDEGTNYMVSSGKEHLLCNLVLSDKNSPPELTEYAMAWITAYEMLKGGK